jgi:hypothetical protein
LRAQVLPVECPTQRPQPIPSCHAQLIHRLIRGIAGRVPLPVSEMADEKMHQGCIREKFLQKISCVK